MGSIFTPHLFITIIKKVSIMLSVVKIKKTGCQKDRIMILRSWDKKRLSGGER
jgi:hypothetical protein